MHIIIIFFYHQNHISESALVSCHIHSRSRRFDRPQDLRDEPLDSNGNVVEESKVDQNAVENKRSRRPSDSLDRRHGIRSPQLHNSNRPVEIGNNNVGPTLQNGLVLGWLANLGPRTGEIRGASVLAVEVFEG